MPVNESTSNLYLQLGIAGATLLILLIFVILLFKFVSMSKKAESNNEVNRIDKLCDKIDALISSNAEHTQKLNEVLLANDKDQKVLIRTLERIQASQDEILKKVVRIDDRTYACLGNQNQKKKEVEE